MAALGEGYDEQLALAADELARLVRRLRSLARGAWSGRRAAVSALLPRLAEIERVATGGPEHLVPDLPDHALADVVAVIGGDALDALAAQPNAGLAAELLAEVREAWSATR